MADDAPVNGNGHVPDDAPIVEEGAHDDAIRALAIRLATSTMVDRVMFAREHGLTFEGARDYYAIFGYDRAISTRQYYEMYRRGGVAGRIVEAFPNATWRGGVEVIEDENPDTNTPFEQAFLELNKRLNVFRAFRQVDMLAQLGSYAVLLLGAGPNDLSQPLGATRSLLSPSAKATTNGLFFVQPYSQHHAKIVEFETDPNNPRFGLPLYYQFKYDSNPLSGFSNRPSVTPFEISDALQRVHWSRVVHVAEGCLENDVYGLPRLERVWNYLLDLIKTEGGGSEAFWLRAHQGIQLDVDPKTKIDPSQEEAFKADLRKQIDEYEHQIRRAFTTRGVNLKVLGADVAQFGNPVDSIITLIAGSLGIPKRILTGSEMGELASSQDRDNWKDQVNGRQTQFAEPYIIRAFIDRCIQFGFLPQPAKDYQIKWAHIEVLSWKEKVEIASGMATVNKTYADSSNGRIVFTDDEIRDHAFGWEPLTDKERENAKEEPPAQPEPQPAVDPNSADQGGAGPLAGSGGGSQVPNPNAQGARAAKRYAAAFVETVDALEKAVSHNDGLTIARVLGNFNEEDHPRDEKGQFAAVVGAGFGQHTAGTFRKYPGGVKPAPPPPKSGRVEEGPVGVWPAKNAKEPPASKSDEAPDKTPDGRSDDTLTHPTTIEGESRNNGGGVNESIKITADDGSEYMFKPIEGEMFGGRAGRIDNRDMPLAEREVLAARFSHELGIGNVPNTLMAEYEGRRGSVQEWVEGDVYDNYGSVDRTETARLAVFDAVIGNLDRHGGNAMVDTEGHLHGIDHGFSFGKTVPNSVSTRGGNRLHELNSFALAKIREGDLSREEQKSIAAKLDNLNFAKVLHGSHIDATERQALYERVNAVSRRLAAGQAHRIRDDFNNAW